MKRSVILPASIIALLIGSASACAWDEDRDDVQPDPGPVSLEAASAGAADAPDGIYLVTETYVDDVVTRSGPVTVYATETVHEVTGSYARVLETVATGARSDFDGTAFNGRASLTDGRSVAGTYYETFVRVGDEYVAVSVVFFQDDLEVARAAGTSPAAAPEAGPAELPIAVTPDVPATGTVAPVIEIAEVSPGAVPDREPLEPVVAPGRPGPGTVTDRAIEVLRARRIAVSFTDPLVRRWSFSGGEALLLGPASGDAGQPFVARWDRLAPVGGSWIVRFALDLTDGSTRELALRVTVRAPGLVE